MVWAIGRFRTEARKVLSTANASKNSLNAEVTTMERTLITIDKLIAKEFTVEQVQLATFKTLQTEATELHREFKIIFRGI